MRAGRPYYFVVLSDHGQSQGATFRQRYGITLRDLVKGLISGDMMVEGISASTDAWMLFNNLLNDAMRNETLSSKALRHALKPRTYQGAVMVGPDHQIFCKECVKGDEGKKPNIVVTASGNLGLVYLADWQDRLTLEEINQRFPLLLAGLTQHQGIGFIMVRSKEHGALVMGKEGIRFLEKGHVQGRDPLEAFGANSMRHLLREDSFKDCPDILVNSSYDPKTGEVSAFEELVGSHGGLGGSQNRPFIIYPSGFEIPTEPLIGGVSLYHLFKKWLEDLSRDEGTEGKQRPYQGQPSSPQPSSSKIQGSKSQGHL